MPTLKLKWDASGEKTMHVGALVPEIKSFANLQIHPTQFYSK